MIASLASIGALMLSTLLMMAGFGLMNYMLPIRAIAEGWSTFTISIIATGYTFGFTTSCVVTPRLVQKVGHVRVFSALITLLTMSVLLCAIVVDWRAWTLFRGIAGFAIAGSYLIIESWLNERSNNENRGGLFSIYMISCLVGSIGGQYIVPLGDPSQVTLFVVCGLIFSAALFPTALSTAQSPAPLAQARFDLKKLYIRSPIAFVGSLLSGALSGTWSSLGAVYSQRVGLSTAEGATFLAAVLAGGAIAQMPLGRLSDRMDRRRVMVGAGLFGVFCCAVMIVLGGISPLALYICGFFVGTVLYPVYSLNVAHANDMADPDEYVTISSAIMILYGFGTVTGPLVTGAIMQGVGPNGLLFSLAISFLLYAGYAAWRMRQRSAVPDQPGKTEFQASSIPLQGTEAVSSKITDL
ncbi:MULTISPECIES: MFS transporter [Rhizobium/Agrobacterium group]|uniref:MFS permease n=2 Tax=Rhizobium/Agrobacterium group TaxID=227290 RepID=B9JU56_ALLAM|nr:MULTISPECIES: MFS transporter [Rhizobium/Agrobacterium group]ACM35984.1 MFS permease [Allorhizobium ampelinum S4]MCF1434464.1 MFS transporter [Allorhizobium ampelinum]MCF1448218.1 MFS transporter [Allorhizobium ampelinum]MCF1460013.1 MFS transporter [Allorhizobium ampelinum]MCF1472844.1 MFS transporter [Allorhizobium ampelinum]